MQSSNTPLEKDFELVRVQRECLRIDIDKSRGGVNERYRFDGRNERERRRDNDVIPSYPHRPERKMERVCPRPDADTMFQPMRTRESKLKVTHSLAEDKLGAIDNGLNGRVNFGFVTEVLPV